MSNMDRELGLTYLRDAMAALEKALGLLRPATKPEPGPAPEPGPPGVVMLGSAEWRGIDEELAAPAHLFSATLRRGEKLHCKVEIETDWRHWGRKRDCKLVWFDIVELPPKSDTDFQLYVEHGANEARFLIGDRWSWPANRDDMPNWKVTRRVPLAQKVEFDFDPWDNRAPRLLLDTVTVRVMFGEGMTGKERVWPATGYSVSVEATVVKP